MKLYHFTAKHLWERIKLDGITMGGVVISLNPPKIKNGYRWLTTNPEFKQDWNAQFMIKYDRQAVRIELEIPITDCRLIKWVPNGREITIQRTFDDLNRFGDPENWWLYKGDIPPSRFTGFVEKDAIIAKGVGEK